MIMTAVAQIAIRASLFWAPPPTTTVAEWAEAHRYLSPEATAAYGKWRSRPYQIEPMQAVSDPAIYRVVLKAATQMIKTSTCENTIGRYVDLDPCPILVIQPRKEDAQAFSEERLDPMIRDTPRLREKVYRNSRKQKKLFRGGQVIVSSAGAAQNAAMRATRILICDEIDKYRLTKEGNFLLLARKRLAEFRGRAKEIDACSPTYENSEIDRAYAQSDRREFFLPCPHCGFEQSLMKKFYTQVRWDQTLQTLEAQALSARYFCQNLECEKPWTEAERKLAIEKGRWIAQAPFNGIAGFWISEPYSVSKELHEIVLDYLQKKDSPEELRTFVNTSLAENFAEQGDTPDWQQLALRKEQYPAEVPKGALVLTAGADVHPDRIEVEVIGHGRNREKWSIRKEIFLGRTTELHGSAGNPTPWDQLEAFMAELYQHELGGDIGVTLLAIDSGNQSQDVYRWVRTQPPSRVIAIKGRETGDPVSEPRPVDVNVYGRKIKNGLKIRFITGPFFKEMLYAGLKKQTPTEEQLADGAKFPSGYCHFPEGVNYGDEYFRQLCSEELRTVRDARGRTRREWHTLRRNEVLDCWVYAMGAAYSLGLDRFGEKHWQEMERRVTSGDLLREQSDALPVPAAHGQEPAVPVAAAPPRAAATRPPARPVYRSRFMS